MEEELRARVEERERRAAEEIEADTQDAEAQWQNRMNVLYARETAVPQVGMWAPGAPFVGNIGIQRREIRYNGPERQKTLDKLPFRGLLQDTDLPFFYDLRLEFPSIPEALLRSVINNTIRPVNVMKLSTEFSEDKADKDEDENFDSADIKGVNYPLRCFTIYSSILFRTVPPGVQTPLIVALLAYIDRLFGYSIVYTLDSIKKFHLVYHNTRIHTGVTDPAGWGQWEQALVNRHLRAREQITTARRPARDLSGQAAANTSYSKVLGLVKKNLPIYCGTKGGLARSFAVTYILVSTARATMLRCLVQQDQTMLAKFLGQKHLPAPLIRHQLGQQETRGLHNKPRGMIPCPHSMQIRHL